MAVHVCPRGHTGLNVIVWWAEIHSNVRPQEQEETAECQRTLELGADVCMWLTDWCAGAFSYWNFSQSEVGQLGISECHKVSPKICRAVKYAAPEVLRIARREAPISTFLSINLKGIIVLLSWPITIHVRLLWIISMLMSTRKKWVWGLIWGVRVALRDLGGLFHLLFFSCRLHCLPHIFTWHYFSIHQHYLAFDNGVIKSPFSFGSIPLYDAFSSTWKVKRRVS